MDFLSEPPVGKAEFQVSTDSAKTWTTLRELSGKQHRIDLAAYAGKTVTLRVRSEGQLSGSNLLLRASNEEKSLQLGERPALNHPGPGRAAGHGV